MLEAMLWLTTGSVLTMIAVIYREAEKERREIIHQSRINLRNLK